MISSSRPFLQVIFPITKYKIPPARSPHTTALIQQSARYNNKIHKVIAAPRELKTAACFVPFFMNNPPTKGQKKLHSRPPKANRFRKKMISGGLIVSKITITPNANVTSVLIFPTFLL